MSGLYSGDNLREYVGVVLKLSKFSYPLVSDLMEQTAFHHNFMMLLLLLHNFMRELLFLVRRFEHWELDQFYILTKWWNQAQWTPRKAHGFPTGLGCPSILLPGHPIHFQESNHSSAVSDLKKTDNRRSWNFSPLLLGDNAMVYTGWCDRPGRQVPSQYPLLLLFY